MRALRPLVALAATAVIAVPIGSAHAAPTKVSGRAISGLSVAAISTAGHALTAATTTASADTITSRLAEVRFIPMTVDGAEILPAVTVTPADSPRHVEQASAQPAPGVSLMGPSGSLFATLTDVTAAAGLRAPEIGRTLGSVNIFGVPVALTGAIDEDATVTDGLARATKTVEISDLSLPSISALLASLGIDLDKLPVGNMNALVDQLGLSAAIQSALDTANAAIDTAQSAVDTASQQLTTAAATLDAATQTLQSRQSDLAAANAAVTSAQGALTSALTTGGFADLAAFQALPAAAQAAFPTIVSAITSVNSATAAQTVAQAAVTTAQSAVTTAQSAVDTTQAAVLAATAPLRAAVAGLADLVRDALDVPLATIASLQVGTIAEVGTAKTARVVGQISGLKIAGTDILGKLGMSSVDLGSATSQLAAVQGAVDSVLGALSTATGALKGITGLNVPAPEITFLDKQASTGTDHGFGIANVDVTALRIGIGQISLPKVIALPSALDGTLAGIVPGGSANLLTVQPTTAVMGQMYERARFGRPSGSTPRANNPATSHSGNLPNTGGPGGLALAAVFVTALGVRVARVVRRHPAA
ncbi:MAG: hypothetical protein ABR520_06600 [Mycobacteriales bacterium]|nr:hypothetical protein [Frankia sp.]